MQISRLRQDFGPLTVVVGGADLVGLIAAEQIGQFLVARHFGAGAGSGGGGWRGLS